MLKFIIKDNFFSNAIIQCDFFSIAENPSSTASWGVNKVISSLSSAFSVFEDGNKENYG